jgi:hypothetical protein
MQYSMNVSLSRHCQIDSLSGYERRLVWIRLTAGPDMKVSLTAGPDMIVSWTACPFMNVGLSG